MVKKPSLTQNYGVPAQHGHQCGSDELDHVQLLKDLRTQQARHPGQPAACLGAQGRAMAAAQAF